MTTPLSPAVLKAIRFMADNAARDPRVLDAICDAFLGAIHRPDTEARIWFDHVGEFVLARDVIDLLLKEPNEVTLKERRVDEQKLTLSFELSNTSAVVIGLKQYRHLTVFDDVLRKAFAL